MSTKLRDIKFEPDYRTGYNDIVDDFLRPSLECATSYWRAVGYFSSSALESFGQPLGTFIKNGGSIRLITSVELSQRDLDAIESGMKKREVCERRIEEIIEIEFAEGVGSGTERLARLLELDRLKILIALPKTGAGIYHEKIGLFFQGSDYVAFTGSSNESRNAFENNRECVDVFPSWSSQKRAARKKEHFEALWNGSDKGVEVYSFPDAARKKLIRICGRTLINGPQMEYKEDRKWRHQDEAVTKFLKVERGILNMATGTGKTRTAMKIIQKLYSTGKIKRVIVSASGNDLLNQWYYQILTIRNEVDAAVYRHYDGTHDIEDFKLSSDRAILIASRSSVAKAIRSISSEFGSKTLLIYDEVHGLGSPETRKNLDGLSNSIRFRLGLSATPERSYDDDGNEFILGHVGPEIFRFALDEAIRRGILASFNYHPLVYEVSSDDKKRIKGAYIEYDKKRAQGKPVAKEDLYMKIAHVHKTSKAKLPIFEKFIDQNRNLLERCIVFVETRDYGKEVIELIHKYRSDFHTYFSGEESGTLKRFANGELECLVTCHRVSEGIDIQSLSSVILFSSSHSNLETIQRMGRCLRTDPSNPAKKANVVDFIRQSKSDKKSDLNSDEMRKCWLAKLSKAGQEKINGCQ